MNFLHSLRNLWGNHGLNRQQSSEQASAGKQQQGAAEYYEQLFARLQTMCNTVPGAKLEMLIGYGEVSLSMKWEPEYEKPEKGEVIQVICTPEGQAAEQSDRLPEKEDCLNKKNFSLNEKEDCLPERGDIELINRHFSDVNKVYSNAKVVVEGEGMSAENATVTSADTAVAMGDVTVTSEKSTVAEKETAESAAAKNAVAGNEAADCWGGTPQLPEKPCKQQVLMRKLKGFLERDYRFRYNVVTEQTEYAHVGEGQSDKHVSDSQEDKLVYLPVDARALNTICMDAFAHNIDCWDKDLKRYIESTLVGAYHPFTEYFRNLPKWDGQDRVTPLAERVSKDMYWTKHFHRWLLATVAQWTQHNDQPQANSVAPILISTRQGLGKSTFCKRLLPKELQRYYTDSFDLNAGAAAEAKLATFGLINLDEYDKLSDCKMPLLKNLMQMNSLNIRKAYKRSSEPLARIASFIGTSNRRDLLTDTTGSRRYLCIEITEKIDNQTPIDHAQLYAQLLHELQSGMRHWFTKAEEAEIEARNKAYYKSSPVQEVFETTFRFAEPHEADARFLTAAQIYKELQRMNPAALRGTTCLTLSKLLPGLGVKVHTKYANGYWVKRIE